MSMDYKKSGVDIDEGNRFVSLIKKMVESTHNSAVLGGIGGFAGFFDLKDYKNYEEPVLVSSTDGVGTKLRVAIDAGRFDTVGIDLVAMSVNDLIVTGAKPLFFLDYIATGKLSAESMTQVVKGIADGCILAETSLLGGETAEMPGMYSDGDFDLAGFAVGILDKSKAVDGSNICEGDILVGLASSGFHSNGYSLVRKVLFEDLQLSVSTVTQSGELGDMLLTPTKVYVKTVLNVLKNGINIKGMVHITGGGFYDNVPRVLPDNCSALIYKDRFPANNVIDTFKSLAIIDEKEMYRVFNMGIGYIFIISPQETDKLTSALSGTGDKGYIIGEVVKNSDGHRVKIKGLDF